MGSGSCGLGLHCVNYRKNGNKIYSEVKDFRLGKKVYICVFTEFSEAVNFPFQFNFKISFRLNIKI